MTLFCICTATRGTRPNEMHLTEPVSVTLRTPMKCIRTGAPRFTSAGHQHYPNVDLYQCERCLTIVAKES